MTPMTALAITCSLKPSPAESSTDLIAGQVLSELETHGVKGDLVRAVDYDIRPGVSDDMGDGDQWATLPGKDPRRRDSCLRNAHLARPHVERGAAGTRAARRRTVQHGRPGPARDGGQGCGRGSGRQRGRCPQDRRRCLPGLNDIGFSIPAQGSTYWNGEAMSGTDYLDLDNTPKAVQSTTASLARNAVHLAHSLTSAKYPAYS